MNPGFYKFPYGSSIAVIGAAPFRVARRIRNDCVHVLDDNRAVLMQAKLAQLPQHPVGRPGQDVELHSVTSWACRSRPQHHHVHHARVIGERIKQASGLFGRAHGANVKHPDSMSG